VHGQDKGQFKWLEPEAVSRSKGSSFRPRGKSLMERRGILDSRRWASVIEVIRERLEVIKFTELPTHTLPDLLKLVNVFGTDNVRLRGSDWKAFDEKLETAVLAEQVWRLVAPEMASAMRYPKPAEVQPSTVTITKRIAGLLGMDSAAMFDAAKLRLPDPKSWKKQAEEEAAMAEKALAKKGKHNRKGKRQQSKTETFTCRECGIEALPSEHEAWPEPDLCPPCEEKLNTHEEADSESDPE